MSENPNLSPSTVELTPPPAGRIPPWMRVGAEVARCAAALAAVLLLTGIYLNTRSSGPGPRQAESSVATVAKLRAGIQVANYDDLLGHPYSKRPVTGTKFVEWIWQRPDFVVQALTDDIGQVDMYTVTAASPDFHPQIPLISTAADPLNLGTARFPDIGRDADAMEGIYPANGKYTYSELFQADGSTHSRALILTSSWDGRSASQFSSGNLDIVGDLNDVVGRCALGTDHFSACASRDPAATAAVARPRGAMRIGGFTVTAADFDPTTLDVPHSPEILDSACNIPGNC